MLSIHTLGGLFGHWEVGQKNEQTNTHTLLQILI